MKILRNLFLILLAVLIMTGQFSIVSAQELVLQKTPLTEEKQQLKDSYRGYVEAYRIAEQEFVVAKGQFQQLNTLANLENAVQKTKAVLLARNDVLETYLDLVYVTLVDTAGVNFDERDVVAQELTVTIQELKDYRAKLENSNDRDSVNLRSDEFELLSPKVISVAHKGMTLIMIGKVQNVYDVARLLHQDLVTAQSQQDLGLLKQQEVNRANQEIDRTFEEIATQMTVVNEHVTKNQAEEELKATYYQRTQELLSPAFSNLSQIVSFLRESL